MADNKMDKLRNLKADNQLETEELDQVAGGSREESNQDAKFLNELMYIAGKPQRISSREYGHPYASGGWFWGADMGQLADVWASVGVKIEDNRSVCGHNNNKYYIDGKEVSREAAYIHAQKKLGAFL